MSMRVVVTGLAATYPLGGVFWDYLAYVDGFRRLGFAVLYLEDTGGWLYDPVAQTRHADPAPNLAALRAALAWLGADDVPWAVRAPDGTLHGADEATVTRFCRGADLFLNVSGACWLREAYRGARRTAYLDTDPGFTQAKLRAVETGAADADTQFSVDLIRAHDRFLTYAEHIDSPRCRVPRGGLDWRPTRQPLVLARWPRRAPVAAGAPYSTVLSWRAESAPLLDGVAYGGKDVSLRPFLDLPARAPVPLELALAGAAPRAALAAQGWRVVDAQARTATLAAYQEYLYAARGEWSVAKEIYVALRSGWFSTRSAAYLAAGKPVVVQDTGWSAHYPTGAGLFAFTTADEALAALAAVEADYAGHCAAARAVAERELDARRVLERLLADVE